ncbi:hypothetical protein FNV43_RR18607 [Rhamnella rubrinervis]|uniref:Uncharacterized protein n=1 Tax=Rhamnella rubrinervis TaxID=2594499 RepID=A0A8K0GWJ9_9ROSA|nr:hypothetical protein FNV43_RR18607 [Rhamnella rubrinervis]
MSSEESRALVEPYLAYSDLSWDSTPSFSSANSSVRVVEPDNIVEHNPMSHVEPNTRRDDPCKFRPRFFIQHPVLMKTDIHSIFKPKDMPFVKEKYKFPPNAVLFTPTVRERAYSVREGWICFYDTVFKIRLRLPFHCTIDMVLDYFNLAPGQLMPTVGATS